MLIENISNILSVLIGGITAFGGAFMGMRMAITRIEARLEAYDKRLIQTEHTLYGNAREGIKTTVERHDYTIGNLCETIAKIQIGG
jgi:hypothetical protein